MKYVLIAALSLPALDSASPMLSTMPLTLKKFCWFSSRYLWTAGPKNEKYVAVSPVLGKPTPVRLPVNTCFLKVLTELGMPSRF